MSLLFYSICSEPGYLVPKGLLCIDVNHIHTLPKSNNLLTEPALQLNILHQIYMVLKGWW